LTIFERDNQVDQRKSGANTAIFARNLTSAAKFKAGPEKVPDPFFISTACLSLREGAVAREFDCDTI